MPHKASYTEEELIALLKGREQQAYSYLYDNYASSLYGVILRVMGECEEVADILQESFVHIWRNVDRYDPAKGRLFTWMLNIARNRAIDFMRSADKKRNNQTNSLEPGEHVQGNESYMPVDHLGLKKVLDNLGADQRIIVEMAYFQGYTQGEIAEKLAIPLGTVKTRARSALLRLKQLLN